MKKNKIKIYSLSILIVFVSVLAMGATSLEQVEDTSLISLVDPIEVIENTLVTQNDMSIILPYQKDDIVLSIGKGKVVKSEKDEVIISLDSGFKVFYSGIADLCVVSGQELERGQLIASPKEGGNIKFSMHYKGKQVDPLDWIYYSEVG